MANKLGTIVTYVEGLLTIKSFNGLIKWPCKVTWQTETIIFPPRVPTTTKLGRVMKRLPHIKLIYLAWRGLARSRDKLKSLHLHCYSAYDHQTLRSFYYYNHLPHPLITWSSLITWKTKSIWTLLVQNLWLLNMERWWRTMKSSNSQNYLIHQWRGFVRSGDMLNTLYLHMHLTNRYQNWQGDDE